MQMFLQTVETLRLWFPALQRRMVRSTTWHGAPALQSSVPYMASCQPKPPSLTSNVTRCLTLELDLETLHTTGESSPVPLIAHFCFLMFCRNKNRRHVEFFSSYKEFSDYIVNVLSSLQSSGPHSGSGRLWEPAGSDGGLGCEEI